MLPFTVDLFSLLSDICPLSISRTNRDGAYYESPVLYKTETRTILESKLEGKC